MAHLIQVWSVSDFHGNFMGHEIEWYMFHGPLNVTLIQYRAIIFGELKAHRDSSTQWTLNSYDKVNPTSLFGYDVQRKKNRPGFTLRSVIPSLHYFYEGLVLTVNQWLCLLELHGTVPSHTAKHHGV